MNSVLKKNTGLKTLLKIRSVINSEYETEDINISLTPGRIASFKYAPTTPCGVEWSFSRYKSILRSNRRLLLFETLKQLYIIAA